MPPSRLQPLPFVEPARLIAYIEQEPALLEAGLRLVARGLPVPGAGPGLSIDLLAVDGLGRVAAIRVVEMASGRDVEDCVAIRSWLSANLPTLRSIAPALSAAGREIRAVLVAGNFSPAARAILAQMTATRPEPLEVRLFDSAAGPAVCFQPPEGVQARLPEPAPERIAAPSASAADPLSGIPLSAAEAEEFRSLETPSSPAYPESFEPRSSARPAPPPPGSFLEN